MNNANTGFAYSPPPGVVEEVKVQTASFDASSGFLTGVTVNMSLKSGTNHLHGQTYYFNQNPAVAATPFFLNRVGTPKLTYKAHRWGGNASGPVYLPKLYDGRNKTFWMYGYEGWWSFDPVSIGFEAVPTPAQRRGDFSGLLGLGSRYQIYDPYSIAPAAGGLFSRQPLPNNIIPSDRIDPLGSKIAQLYDLPNLPGTADGVNNYTNGRNSHDNYYNHIFRLDHHISEKAALLCARECHQKLPRAGPAPQRHGGPHSVPVQPRRGDRSCLHRLSVVSDQHALQLHALYRRELSRSGRLGSGGFGLLSDLSSIRSTPSIRAPCDFRRSPRRATPRFPCRPGTRIRSTRTTSR